MIDHHHRGPEYPLGICTLPLLAEKERLPAWRTWPYNNEQRDGHLTSVPILSLYFTYPYFYSSSIFFNSMGFIYFIT